jgi:hypothetical protein
MLPGFEPTAAMEAALGRVQHDMDIAGLGPRVLRFAVAGEMFDRPVVVAGWLGGGSHPDDPFDVECDDVTAMTVDLAEATAQGLIETENLYWPICPAHRARGRAALDERGRAVWHCSKRGTTPHSMCEVGGLDQLLSHRPQRPPLVCTLDELSSR